MVRAQRTCSSLKLGAAQRAPGNTVSGGNSMMLANEHAWIYTHKFKNSSFSFLIPPRLAPTTCLSVLSTPSLASPTVTATVYLSRNESSTPCISRSLINRMTERPLYLLFSVQDVLHSIYAWLTSSLTSGLSSNAMSVTRPPCSLLKWHSPIDLCPLGCYVLFRALITS